MTLEEQILGMRTRNSRRRSMAVILSKLQSRLQSELIEQSRVIMFTK